MRWLSAMLAQPAEHRLCGGLCRGPCLRKAYGGLARPGLSLQSAGIALLCEGAGWGRAGSGVTKL